LLLSCVLSPSLESNLGITVHLSDSVEWKLWNHVEWSVNVEAKLFIESLSLSLISFIKIDNWPSLVDSSICFPNSYRLSFLVFCRSV
jgi:hypothetical protein